MHGVCSPLYRPRDFKRTALHQVIAELLEASLRAAAEAGGLVAGIVVEDEAVCHLAAVRRPIHLSTC